ncbi:signal recognition particle-docking protein FtsY [Candidatus Parvarchaeota archaeon]|nr:signal recognition particle-docking protein FtsY [Candidatus Parvarchaeota archaeon]
MSKKALKEQAGEHKVQPKLGIVSSITSLFASQITITESDVSDLLDSLELSLLEGDVSYEVSQDIVSSLRSRLIGTKLPKSNLSGSIQSIIREVLVKTMTPQCSFDLMESAKGAKKPYKILFVGPNGAGKTTTMAKLAKAFQAAGLSCVFAAADTFRAAAIEQLEVHAGRLGIHAVKSQYGADPASVAFDAIKYAQGHGIDAVLIDSSGRQDTNANLLAELKKIVRIASPDAKIYIGESLAGNSVVAQVGAFNQAIGLDAVILTKLDCDPKGGCAISITKATGVPVIFVGTGQSYSDLKKFNPDEIASELVAA